MVKLAAQDDQQSSESSRAMEGGQPTRAMFSVSCAEAPRRSGSESGLETLTESLALNNATSGRAQGSESSRSGTRSPVHLLTLTRTLTLPANPSPNPKPDPDPNPNHTRIILTLTLTRSPVQHLLPSVSSELVRWREAQQQAAAKGRAEEEAAEKAAERS